MKRLVWILFLFIIGCSGDEIQKKEELIRDSIVQPTISEPVEKEVSSQARTDESDFLEFYKKFIIAIINKRDSEVNACIHQNFGLYFIETNGAMPMLTQFYQYSNFDHKESVRLAIESLDSTSLLIPKKESLPKVICDEEIYDKQGCFAQEINPLLESQIWNYAGLNEKEIQAIESLVETVKMTVINTSNYTFYFSLIDGNWHLTFIDIRIPCTA